MIIYESIMERFEHVMSYGDLVEVDRSESAHCVYFSDIGDVVNYQDGAWLISRTSHAYDEEIVYAIYRFSDGEQIECNIDSDERAIEAVKFELFLCIHWNEIVPSDVFQKMRREHHQMQDTRVSFGEAGYEMDGPASDYDSIDMTF